MIQYKDLQVKDFIFRFFLEGNEWVCKMPHWLMEEAEKQLGRIRETEQPRTDANTSAVSDKRD